MLFIKVILIRILKPEIFLASFILLNNINLLPVIIGIMTHSKDKLYFLISIRNTCMELGLITYLKDLIYLGFNKFCLWLNFIEANYSKIPKYSSFSKNTILLQLSLLLINPLSSMIYNLNYSQNHKYSHHKMPIIYSVNVNGRSNIF